MQFPPLFPSTSNTNQFKTGLMSGQPLPTSALPNPPNPSTKKSGGGWDDQLGALAAGVFAAALSTFTKSAQPEGQDWYKVFPYQLVIVKYRDIPPPGLGTAQAYDLGNGDMQTVTDQKAIDTNYVFTLPIPPEMLSVSTVSSSEATATLGGVVEETTETTFWNIQLSGTTGMAIGYTKNSNSIGMADSFRSALSTTGLLAGAKSSIAQAVGGLGTIVDAGIDAFQDITDPDNGSVVGVAGAAFGGLANVLAAASLPKLPYFSSAVDGTSNGFTIIKDLKNVFEYYSAYKEESPQLYDLFFINQKDNEVYQVILSGGIQVQKNAKEPYLYRYSFTLKGWEKSSMDQSIFQLTKTSIDRFKTDLKTVNTFNTVSLSQTMNNIQANALK
jgi:hypothetical protein